LQGTKDKLTNVGDMTKSVTAMPKSISKGETFDI